MDPIMSSVYWMLYLAALVASVATVRGDPSTTNLPFHELSRQIFTPPKNTSGALFGYSIAHQKSIHSLVVGSPRENAIGHVYRCQLSKEDKICTAFSYKGEETDEKFATNGTNNHSFWFGATVNAGKGYIMACAPRHTRNDSDDYHGTHGKCYYAETTNLAAPMTPMIDIDDNGFETYHINTYKNKSASREAKSDSLGWSSYISSEGIIYVGGPFISVGRVTVYDSEKDKAKLIEIGDTKYYEDKVISNFGYSITSGFFLADEEWIAISSPYGTKGFGMVHFFKREIEESTYKNVLIQYTRIDSETDLKDLKNQRFVGSLFGASLASLKKDKTSALLVGAPAYTSSGYDEGAVFIYHLTPEDLEPQFQLIKMLQPTVAKNGGRFGSTIVCVSDYDGDDIQEVAIAAPYEDGGKGAVYIYSGKSLLDRNLAETRLPWLQRLEPKEGSTPYYGLSLSSLADDDENGCNELAVGAPGINSVTLYYCIASVKVYFEPVDFKDMERLAETLKTSDAKIKIKPCLKVDKKNDKPKTLESIVTLSFRINHPNVRIESADSNNNYEVKRKLESKMCEDLVIVLPQEADFDQNITLDMSVTLNENPLMKSKFSSGSVLLNNNIRYSQSVTMPSISGSELSFKVTTTIEDDYLIGKSEYETLLIEIRNTGRTAHKPRVTVDLSGLTVSNIANNNRRCSVQNGALNCVIEKLNNGASEVLNITLSMKSLSGSSEKLVFFSSLFKSNGLVATHQYNMTRYLQSDLKVKIQPLSHKVNVSKEDLDTKGKRVDHYYKIINDGITVWRNLTSEISLPGNVLVERVTINDNSCSINKTALKAFCHIRELRGKDDSRVRVQMKIEPGSPLAETVKRGKATVDTSLSLKLIDTISNTTTTIVTLWKGNSVPLWMIVVAVLLAILIIIVLFWALHECGCLKRQNKQMLKDLKKEVHRQSVRKSMMLRQSHIEVIPNKIHNDDRQRLINVSEKEDGLHKQTEQKANGINLDNQTKETTQQNNIMVNAQQANHNIVNDKQAHESNGQENKDMVNAQQSIDKANVLQTKDLDNMANVELDKGNMVNARPVKEIHHDQKSPACIAFNAELAKALANKKSVTKAEIH